MTQTPNNSYRFTTKEERHKRMNSFFLLAVDLLFLILLFYQVIQNVKPDKDNISTDWNVFILIVFCVYNIVIYLKNKSTSLLRVSAVVEVGFEFLVLSLHPTATFMSLALIGVLCVLIPYYDGRLYNITLAVYAVLFTVVQLTRFVNKVDSFTASGLCEMLIIYALLVVLVRTGSLSKVFSDHALASSESQSDHLSQLLDEIIEISRTIKEESDATSQTIEFLLESALNTTDSMEHIAKSANITANNIEEQTGMTHNIQLAIMEAQEYSKEMVSIATTSSEEIEVNQQMLVELREQAEHVKDTNQQITAAMAKLSKNIKEVEEVAGIILNISSQTNMLALNASIESARAGEAGRGFAIVAEQIRQLSEETRTSTESITALLNELDVNTRQVVSVMNSSVEATENQNTMIVKASDAFGKLHKNMSELLNNIDEIDYKIDNLSDANNTIVDNITNLSANTEEVTAIAEETNDLSKQNLEYTEQAKKAISLIQDNANRLEKYIY